MRMTCRTARSEWTRRVSRAIVAWMIVTAAIPGGVAQRVVRASDVIPPNPPTPREPIVGFADTHLHQFSNLGFGGLILWGSPFDPTKDPTLFGASESDPLRRAARARALPSSDAIYLSNSEVTDYLYLGEVPVVSFPTTKFCDPSTEVYKQMNGSCWPQCPAGTGVMGNACWRVEIHGPGGSADLINSFGGGGSTHGTIGYPDMQGWPAFDVVTTQAAYWEWLKRAHGHGLQLIVMLAVNNTVLCHVGPHRISFGCDDDSAVDRQIQGAKDLEAYIDALEGGDGFYKIVYSAAEARAAIADEKLAVVLGAEVDAPWRCFADSLSCTEGQIATHVQDYYDKGIRVMYPVHVVDNAFGGSALYTGVFEIANALLNNGRFFDMGPCQAQLEWRSDIRDLISEAKDTIDTIVEALLAAGPIAAVLLPLIAPILPLLMVAAPAITPALGIYAPVIGTLGATIPAFSAVLGPIAPLVGTVVPLLAVTLIAFIYAAPGVVVPEPLGNCNKRTLTGVGTTLVKELMDRRMIIDVDHTDTPTFDEILKLAEARHYPGIVSGHTALVGAALTRDEAEPILQSFGQQFNASETPRSEASKTDETARRIIDVGGLVSIGLSPGGRGTVRHFDQALPFDCGNSSKAWAQTYLYATKQIGLTAINFGSDMNGFGGLPAPRYGPNACGGEPPAPGYDFQNGKLVYDVNLKDYSGHPLSKYTFGNRTWDYNVDGFAHVGMYPDFIADLQKVGLSHEDLAPLFRGAEAYVRMWEKIDDMEAPTVRCGTVGDDWHADDVSVPCLAFDEGWDLKDPAEANFSLATNVPVGTETGDASTGTHAAICDGADQCTGTIPAITGINVDKKDPEVVVTTPAAGTPSYVVNQNVAASYTCADGGSGVASCTAPVANGAALDTSVGGHQFTVTGSDNVGHVVSIARPYVVGFAVCLLYDVTRAHRAGSTVPIKVTLCDSAGANLSQESVVLTATGIRQISTNAPGALEDSGNANPDDRFRYDAALGGYVFNLKTTGFANGTYALSFTATGDPTTHTVQFQIR